MLLFLSLALAIISLILYLLCFYTRNKNLIKYGTIALFMSGFINIAYWSIHGNIFDIIIQAILLGIIYYVFMNTGEKNDR